MQMQVGGSLNYTAAILDEIALEGLDGITFPALEARLRASKGLSLLSNAAPDATSSAKLCDLCWAVARASADVQVFRLAEPRKKLVIFDRCVMGKFTVNGLMAAIVLSGISMLIQSLESLSNPTIWKTYTLST